MAQLPLALVTALRFSKGRKRAGMVSLISIISTLGIMLGVAVLIIGLSAMNGFERELKNRILSVVPHGQIYSVEQPFISWQPALSRIENTEGVVAAAPYILLTGLLEKGTELKAVQVMGLNRINKVISVYYRAMCKIMHGNIFKRVNSKSLLAKVLPML